MSVAAKRYYLHGQESEVEGSGLECGRSRWGPYMQADFETMKSLDEFLETVPSMDLQGTLSSVFQPSKMILKPFRFHSEVEEALEFECLTYPCKSQP